MANYVTLLGAERVSSAASNMCNAAETISQAAASIENSLQQQRIFMNEWILRLAELIKPEDNNA